MVTATDRRLLITGSGGMVGGSISRAARGVGWNIFTPTRAELDLRDYSKVVGYLLRNDINSIIHCAAKVGGIAANISAPADFILENIAIDSSLILSAREAGIQDLIYLASSCMYPKVTSQPMKVEQLLSSYLEPTNEGYALAKIAGTKSIVSVATQESLNWRVLIPSNLYGPGDNFDLTSSHLIPATIRKIYSAVYNKQNEVEIWGDGHARREFTYVDDVSSFIINNMDFSERWPLMMNIGYGIDFSINEYYEVIASELSYDGNFSHDLTKPVGMSQKLLDSKVAVQFGWEASTSLELGVRKTVNWFKENVINA